MAFSFSCPYRDEDEEGFLECMHTRSTFTLAQFIYMHVDIHALTLSDM